MHLRLLNLSCHTTVIARPSCGKIVDGCLVACLACCCMQCDLGNPSLSYDVFSHNGCSPTCQLEDYPPPSPPPPGPSPPPPPPPVPPPPSPPPPPPPPPSPPPSPPPPSPSPPSPPPPRPPSPSPPPPPTPPPSPPNPPPPLTNNYNYCSMGLTSNTGTCQNCVGGNACSVSLALGLVLITAHDCSDSQDCSGADTRPMATRQHLPELAHEIP